MGALANHIRHQVAAASPDQRRDIIAESIQALLEVNRAKATGTWSRDASQAMTVAVEMLVQIESLERNKGPWYRLRRRADLIGLYIGPNAFFRTPREIDADAAQLKFACDISMARYFKLEAAELSEAVKRDFPNNQGGIDRHRVSFVYPQASDFLFSIPTQKDDERQLCAQGCGKYEGFILFMRSNGFATANVSEEFVYYPPTPAARELVRVMARKYGVQDHSALMARLRGR